MRCQQYGHTKNYCNRSPACVKCAKNHLTAHCPYSGKIEKVKCFNCNGNHPASYKGCEVRKQLQRKLFPPLRSRTSTNTQTHQDSTKPEIIPNTEQAINTKPISTNTIGGLSYAQVTSQPTHTHNQYHSNSNNDTAEIKELLKQSIKNTEMLTRMISEQKRSTQTANPTNHSHATTNYKRAKQKIKTDTLKIAAWNSNGLQQRALET